MSKLGQVPEPAQSGGIIPPARTRTGLRGSSAIQVGTGVSGITSLTLGAKDSATETGFTQGSVTVTKDGQLLTAEDVDFFPFQDVDLFVDTSGDVNFLLGIGDSLSTAQKKIVCGRNSFISTESGKSWNYVITYLNQDSSSHTIYVRSQTTVILNVGN